MRIQVQTLQMPRWIIPVLLLAALALIPFALMLGLALAVLAVGTTALRLLFVGPPNPISENSKTRVFSNPHKQSMSGPVLDAEYEIKEDNEKE